MKKLKIRTLKGRVITLSVTRDTDSHYFGVDKFGHDVVLNKDTIDSLHEIEGSENDC